MAEDENELKTISVQITRKTAERLFAALDALEATRSQSQWEADPAEADACDLMDATLRKAVREQFGWDVQPPAGLRSLVEPTTCEEFLAVLRKFFDRRSPPPGWPKRTEQQRVWDVLTALRGPDVDFSGIPYIADPKEFAREAKAAVTGIVRERVIGMANMTMVGCDAPRTETPEMQELRQVLAGSKDHPVAAGYSAEDRAEAWRRAWHFSNHGMAAFAALGLKW